LAAVVVLLHKEHIYAMLPFLDQRASQKPAMLDKIAAYINSKR
jgi:hypothetical protein